MTSENEYSMWTTKLTEKPHNSTPKSKKRNMLWGSLNKKEEKYLTNIEKKLILTTKIKQTIKLKKELEKELKKIFKLEKKSTKKKKVQKKNTLYN